VKNRSVPTDSVLPHLSYPDVAKAIEWLTGVFGFTEHYRYGNPASPSGAQMHFGSAYFMLEASREGRVSPSESGTRNQYLTVFVADVDAFYERVKAAGATIGEEINEPIYGERQFGAIDLAGHFWLFSQHIHDADPADWGAQVANRP